MKKIFITGAAGVILVVLLCLYAEQCHEHNTSCETCDPEIKAGIWNG